MIVTSAREGDEVEVTVKGVVREVTPERLTVWPVGLSRLQWLTLQAGAVDRIEVTKRARPKVGDTVKTGELGNLPKFTVVTSSGRSDGRPYMVGSVGLLTADLHGPYSYQHLLADTTYTVVYVPPEK